MTKKLGLIAIVILIAIAAFAMNMRRSRMMGGAGSQIELMAVSADGSQISPAADVISITGELPAGKAAQQLDGMIVVLSLNPYPPSVGQGEFDITLTDLNLSLIHI